MDNVGNAIRKLLSTVIDVIAIGQPGERFPARGAARIYFPENEWVKGVSTLVQDAKFVIFKCDLTAGLLQEIAIFAEYGHLEQLVLLTEDIEKKWE